MPARRNTEALRARRREVLLDAVHTALVAAAADGETFAGLPVERLIAAAGVSRSTFYSYFADKDVLLDALAERALDAALTAARHWYSLPPRATRADLHDALGRVLDAYVEHHVVLVAVSEASSRSEDATKSFEMLMDRSTEALAAYIRRGQEERFVDPRLDPEPTAAWLMWMSEGGLSRLVSTAGPAERRTLHAGLTDIFWNGLRMGGA